MKSRLIYKTPITEGLYPELFAKASIRVNVSTGTCTGPYMTFTAFSGMVVIDKSGSEKAFPPSGNKKAHQFSGNNISKLAEAMAEYVNENLKRGQVVVCVNDLPESILTSIGCRRQFCSVFESEVDAKTFEQEERERKADEERAACINRMTPYERHRKAQLISEINRTIGKNGEDL